MGSFFSFFIPVLSSTSSLSKEEISDMAKWVKSEILGAGSFGYVFLAKPLNASTSHSVPSVIAVKSAPLENSSSLKVEREILYKFRNCPEIIRCFGEDQSFENGNDVYNLLLEYAPGGSLGSMIKDRAGGKLPEWEGGWYTYLLLKALSRVHEQGYVHCDIKPSNILVFPCKIFGIKKINYVKIADFGLAKRAVEGEQVFSDGWLRNYRGTALYASPESILFGQRKAAMDIWSLGCTVVEMITGKPAWRYGDVDELLYKIAFEEDEMPEIPKDMSAAGKDFLVKCFKRDPLDRGTAKELLHHPFILENIRFMPKSYGNPVVQWTSFYGFDRWISERNMFSIGHFGGRGEC